MITDHNEGKIRAAIAYINSTVRLPYGDGLDMLALVTDAAKNYIAVDKANDDLRTRLDNTERELAALKVAHGNVCNELANYKTRADETDAGPGLKQRLETAVKNLMQTTFENQQLKANERKRMDELSRVYAELDRVKLVKDKAEMISVNLRSGLDKALEAAERFRSKLDSRTAEVEDIVRDRNEVLLRYKKLLDAVVNSGCEVSWDKKNDPRVINKPSAEIRAGIKRTWDKMREGIGEAASPSPDTKAEIEYPFTASTLDAVALRELVEWWKSPNRSVGEPFKLDNSDDTKG